MIVGIDLIFYDSESFERDKFGPPEGEKHSDLQGFNSQSSSKTPGIKSEGIPKETQEN